MTWAHAHSAHLAPCPWWLRSALRQRRLCEDAAGTQLNGGCDSAWRGGEQGGRKGHLKCAVKWAPDLHVHCHPVNCSSWVPRCLYPTAPNPAQPCSTSSLDLPEKGTAIPLVTQAGSHSWLVAQSLSCVRLFGNPLERVAFFFSRGSS